MGNWSRTHHENVQRLLGYCTDIVPHVICFVSPWMENGHAREFIEKTPTTNRITLVRAHCILSGLSRFSLLFKLREIAEGLTYLHGQGIIHGDIRGVSTSFIFGRPLLTGSPLSRITSQSGQRRKPSSISVSLRLVTMWV
jgi:serine/threonine protein kinase